MIGLAELAESKWNRKSILKLKVHFALYFNEIAVSKKPIGPYMEHAAALIPGVFMHLNCGVQFSLHFRLTNFRRIPHFTCAWFSLHWYPV